jgi:hypothetical protein
LLPSPGASITWRADWRRDRTPIYILRKKFNQNGEANGD